MGFLNEFRSLFTPLSFAGVMFAIWVLSFVLLPIAARILGARGERIGTSAGVVASVALAAALMVPTHGPWAIAILVGVPVLGWVSEFAGWKTGIPFGKYHYTDELRPHIGRVPVVIPLAWLMLMPAAWAVATVIAPESRLLQCVVAAAAFTSWDLFVDPQMVSRGYWVWAKPGRYAGIPLLNFAGWFLVSFLITGFFSLLSGLAGFDMLATLETGPFLFMFGITWILQSVGHMAFWKLRLSAVVGFFGMGLFVLLVMLRIS